MRFPASEAMHAEALELMPGGVSSPIRAFRPHPIHIARGEGKHIWDVDGNRYLDCCLGYGPLILGHSHPDVVSAVEAQMRLGSGFGAPSEAERGLAAEICRRVPCADMVRLANSGTEATMHALRLARGYTGRERVVKLDGGFHGAHDSLMVKGGSGIMEQGLPQCAGVPGCLASLCSVVPFNDLGAMEAVLGDGGCAALILEPVMGNCGTISPDPGYLEGVRRLCDESGTVLIFDEVITGARLAPGGAQELLGVMPDLCTMGKAIGGGLPIGALMGKREIMSMVSPQGPVYMAGTFSGNPLTAAAGLAALGRLGPREYRELDRRGESVRAGLRDMLEDEGLVSCVNGVGSMFQVFIGRDSVSSAAEAMACDAEIFRRFFREMLSEGVYMPPSQFETNFLSTAHGDEDLEAFVSSARHALRRAVR